MAEAAEEAEHHPQPKVFEEPTAFELYSKGMLFMGRKKGHQENPEEAAASEEGQTVQAQLKVSTPCRKRKAQALEQRKIVKTQVHTKVLDHGCPTAAAKRCYSKAYHSTVKELMKVLGMSRDEAKPQARLAGKQALRELAALGAGAEIA